ncbi:MAG: efflux RND transporter periplasmic adaptor subunit [Acidobacteriota bacterium]|nr:efflux RND transporter periplasmic adaptor subunit [Acidobacteriota bacterium]
MKVQEHSGTRQGGNTHLQNNQQDNQQRHGVGFLFLAVLLLVLGAIGWFVYKGIHRRVSTENALVQETHRSSVLTVSVVHPKLSTQAHQLNLPGNTQPLIDAPIYSRTSGYLRKWYADIGTKVRAGQLLAEIEAPEVDQQLMQARSELQTAQTNFTLSQTTAGRYSALLQKGAVARQDVDNSVADMNSKKSIAESAAANVKRLEELQRYQKIVAPFDGVITARNTDVGALIDAGAGGTGKELFHISSTSRLRIFVNVPEEYERAAVNGSTVTLTLSEFPGRAFTGIIVRNSHAIDPASRTLLVEVDVNNANGDLLPGAYVSVHMNLTGSSVSAMTIPVNTVLFRAEGLRAAVVRDGKALLTPFQVDHDFGDSLEVVAGLKPDENLIINPPDSLVSGTPVRIADKPAQ